MRNNMLNISLGDPSLFELAIGKRKTKRELLLIPFGKIPIISARLDRPFGFVESKSFVCSNSKLVLWNIDSSRWDTRVLDEYCKFIPTDHCGYMKILNPKIVPEYVAYKLYECGLHAGFKHEYRASLSNIRDMFIPIPIDETGDFDVGVQNELAQSYQRCVRVRNELLRIIDDLSSKRINIVSVSKFVRVSIGDFMSFEKGKAKYTEKFCEKNKGVFPVYSAGTKGRTTIGYINSFDYELECLKITTNGHYAGTVEYLERSKFSLNGDAGILYVTDPSCLRYIDYLYLEYVLQKAREQYGFNWTNKPLEDDIKAIEIMIPIKNKKWDIVEQQRIAKKYKQYKDYLLRLKMCVDGLNKQFIKVD